MGSVSSVLIRPIELTGCCAGHWCDHCAGCDAGACCGADTQPENLPSLGDIEETIIGALGTLERSEDYVVCPICLKSMRALTNTHLRAHDTTAAEAKAILGLNRGQSLSCLSLKHTRRELALRRRSEGKLLSAFPIGAGGTAEKKSLRRALRPVRLQAQLAPLPERLVVCDGCGQRFTRRTLRKTGLRWCDACAQAMANRRPQGWQMTTQSGTCRDCGNVITTVRGAETSRCPTCRRAAALRSQRAYAVRKKLGMTLPGPQVEYACRRCGTAIVGTALNRRSVCDTCQKHVTSRHNAQYAADPVHAERKRERARVRRKGGA